jgi:hypothetical protein
VSVIALKKSQPVPVLARPLNTGHPSSNMSVPSPATSLVDVRSALQAIPNEGAESLDYDSWRNVIFALHHATGGSDEGLALAHEFSSRSAKYDPDFLAERVWPYVKTERSGKVITERTIFDMALKHGWAEPVLDFEDLDAQALAPAENPVTDKAPAATPAPAAPKPMRFAFEPVGVFVKRPPPEWIVRQILPRAELAVIIGESGAGKSFFAFDLAAAIALGQPWRGYKVTSPGRVAYIAAEGAGGFRNRVCAYAQHNELSMDLLQQISVLPDNPNLLQKDDVRDIAIALKALGKVDAVFIDTLAQTTAGGDENSSESMGRVLAHCKAIHRATGALVVPIHHVGKDTSRGARGWSGIKGAADAEITIVRDQYGRKAVVSKMKDGDEGMEFPFKLKVVEVGTDQYGDIIDSCVIEHLDAEQAQARREPKGSVQKAVWRSLNDLVLIGDTSVPLASLLDNVTPQLPHDPAGKRDRRREIVTRAVQQLQDEGFLVIDNGSVRPKGAS